MAREKGKILIVDDDEDTLFIYAEMLTRAGYKVSEARNGREALDAARKMLPDLIIMDIMMPKADGMSAILKLKGDEKTRSIPVVVSTSLDGAEDKTVAANLGVAGFVVKGTDPEKLLNKIKEVLKHD